ncbi:MAG: sporulation protein YabP [Clostridia bacterium]|nr:sporulation protein YabP [Clostridia bacterium]
MEEKIRLEHKIVIDERKSLIISGVKEVKNFDDETLVLDTVMGRITVKGEKLHIISFNTETGDLTAEGRIHAVVYISEERRGGGALSRIFR